MISVGSVDIYGVGYDKVSKSAIAHVVTQGKTFVVHVQVLLTDTASGLLSQIAYAAERWEKMHAYAAATGYSVGTGRLLRSANGTRTLHTAVINNTTGDRSPILASDTFSQSQFQYELARLTKVRAIEAPGTSVRTIIADAQALV